MGLINRFREAWAVKSTNQVVGARIIPLWAAAQKLASPHDYTKFAEEGYRRNLVAAACVWVLATSAAEPKLVVKQKVRSNKGKGHDLEPVDSNHPLQLLLDNPNPEQSTYQFMETLFTYQQTMGNWFVRKIRALSGRGVVQLWAMRPDRIKIVPNAEGWVDKYTYDRSGVAVPIEATDMIHDPFHPDPLNDYWGLSPIAVLASVIDMDNNAIDFMRCFFQNNGTPAGLLKLKARTQPEDRYRLKEIWQKEHTGEHGWNTIGVLDADADFQPIGADTGKLGFDKLFDRTEARICAAFGVPAILAGQVVGLNRSTFANYKEARVSLWKDTLVPLYKRCGDKLTKGLCNGIDFPKDLVIEFDLTTVEALQEDRTALEERVIKKWEADAITFNEMRQELGLDPVTDERGNKYMSEVKPKGLPVDEGQPPAPGMPPASGMRALLEDDEDNEEEVQRRRPSEAHVHTYGPEIKRSMRELKKTVSAHFEKQTKELVAVLK